MKLSILSIHLETSYSNARQCTIITTTDFSQSNTRQTTIITTTEKITLDAPSADLKKKTDAAPVRLAMSPDVSQNNVKSMKPVKSKLKEEMKMATRERKE